MKALKATGILILFLSFVIGVASLIDLASYYFDLQIVFATMLVMVFGCFALGAMWLHIYNSL